MCLLWELSHLAFKSRIGPDLAGKKGVWVDVQNLDKFKMWSFRATVESASFLLRCIMCVGNDL